MRLSPHDVLYEDNHLLVVNKPAGLLVQGDKTGDETLADLAKEYIKQKYNKPGDVFLGIVHRIDRPVSGVVVLARTSKALERLNTAFRDRKVKKEYWALVQKRPPQVKGHCEHWIRKNRDKNKSVALTKPGKGALKSILDYELIGRIAGYYLLDVHPETGRPHQIRVQLAKIGCPIAGDLKYGAPSKSNDGRIYLHSREIIFPHPVKKENVRITAGLPNDQVWQMFKGI